VSNGELVSQCVCLPMVCKTSDINLNIDTSKKRGRLVGCSPMQDSSLQSLLRLQIPFVKVSFMRAVPSPKRAAVLEIIIAVESSELSERGC